MLRSIFLNHFRISQWSDRFWFPPHPLRVLDGPALCRMTPLPCRGEKSGGWETERETKREKEREREREKRERERERERKMECLIPLTSLTHLLSVPF
jgi:hypothetical protein